MDFQGWKWGEAGAGSAGGVVTWSFAALALPGSQFEYLTPAPEFQAEIRQAFSAWEAVANIDFVEVADAGASHIRVGLAHLDGPGGMAGQAYYLLSGDSAYRPLGAEIAFDCDEAWVGTSTGITYGLGGTPFEALALHEIGHAIGIGHSDGTLDIMSPVVPIIDGLQFSDIAAAQALYGSQYATALILGG